MELNSIEDELRAALDAPEEEVVVESDSGRERDDKGRFKSKAQEEEAEDQPQVEETPALEEEKPEEVKPQVEAPQSLPGEMKARWKDLPEDVQKYFSKRESDVHRMMTAPDGELSLGRRIKEIASPYEPIIRAEGGTVDGAFRDLLNTAYILRTGSPQAKLNLILQTAQQYGVDLGQVSQQSDPMANIHQRLQQIEQQANPDHIRSQLHEEMQRARIQQELSSFEQDPKNTYFQQVRTAMGSLMMSGQAGTLQEAYEKACWADPAIRSTLISAQAEQERAKQRSQLEAKKKAAASVTGSPGVTSPSIRAPQKSLEDELRDALTASDGAI